MPAPKVRKCAVGFQLRRLGGEIYRYHCGAIGNREALAGNEFAAAVISRASYARLLAGTMRA